MRYNRILLKISGEALAGSRGYGICSKTVANLSEEIKELSSLGIEVGVVIGAGNLHRGGLGEQDGMDRVTSDQMGMLGTVMNALALQDALERSNNVVVRVLTAIPMQSIAEPYIRRRALRHLEKKRVVIFAAGTGNPYFTTDTAAALRASEISSQVIFKATKVDGIYDKDPMKYEDAARFESMDYLDVLKRKITIMDSAAISLCMDKKIEIIVFNIFKRGNIRRAVMGERVGTRISSEG